MKLSKIFRKAADLCETELSRGQRYHACAVITRVMYDFNISRFKSYRLSKYVINKFEYVNYDRGDSSAWLTTDENSTVFTDEGMLRRLIALELAAAYYESEGL
jgi:hypothetical protein